MASKGVSAKTPPWIASNRPVIAVHSTPPLSLQEISPGHAASRQHDSVFQLSQRKSTTIDALQRCLAATMNSNVAKTKQFLGQAIFTPTIDPRRNTKQQKNIRQTSKIAINITLSGTQFAIVITNQQQPTQKVRHPIMLPDESGPAAQPTHPAGPLSRI